MSAGNDAVVETASPVARAHHPGAPVHGRKLSRTKREEAKARSKYSVIASALFFVLIAAALLLGGRAAIAPLLQPAAPLRDARRTGDVVYTMPDGVFCRHLTFDNVTGNIREGSLEPCVNTLAKLDNREVPAFARANH